VRHRIVSSVLLDGRNLSTLVVVHGSCCGTGEKVWALQQLRQLSEGIAVVTTRRPSRRKLTPTGTPGERPLKRMHCVPAGTVPPWSRLRSRGKGEQRFEDSRGFQHANLQRIHDGGGSLVRFPVPYTGGPGWSVLIQSSVSGGLGV